MPGPLAYLVTFRCHRPIAGWPPPYSLADSRSRDVLESIQRVCRHWAWTLHAAGVRPDRADAVVVADESPTTVLHAFECYATRLLHQRADRAEKRWAESGGAKYLWREEDVAAAVRYVTAGEAAVYREQAARRLGKWAGTA